MRTNLEGLRALRRCEATCAYAKQGEAAAWGRLRWRLREAFGPLIVATRDAQA